jgi:hypothetical protein
MEVKRKMICQLDLVLAKAVREKLKQSTKGRRHKSRKCRKEPKIR